MNELYLIGGGGELEVVSETFGRFAKAANRDGRLRIALVLARENDEVDLSALIGEFLEIFETAGVSKSSIQTICISSTSRLTVDDLSECNPTGIFIGGGSTPLYRDLLYADQGWLDYVREARIPYGGYSAGSAVVSKSAVVGGWKALDGTPVLDPDFDEGLETVTAVPGLGMTPFSIDVHCSQWGTITRLMRAVLDNQISIGLGIDEETMLQVADGRAQVYGIGQVYLVRKSDDGELRVQVIKSGQGFRFDESGLGSP